MLTILAACNGEADPSEIAFQYRNLSHGDLKRDVIEALDDVIKKPREHLLQLKTEKAYLEGVAKDGAEAAKAMTYATLSEVKKRIGLI